MTGSICMFPESFIAFQFGPLLKRGPDETHGLAVAIAAVILIGEHFTEPVVRSLRKSAQSPLCPFQRLLEITGIAICLSNSHISVGIGEVPTQHADQCLDVTGEPGKTLHDVADAKVLTPFTPIGRSQWRHFGPFCLGQLLVLRHSLRPENLRITRDSVKEYVAITVQFPDKEPLR